MVQKEADSALERYNTNQVKRFLEPNAAAIDFMQTVNSSIAQYPLTENVPAFATEGIDDDDIRAYSAKMR